MLAQYISYPYLGNIHGCITCPTCNSGCSLCRACKCFKNRNVSPEIDYSHRNSERCECHDCTQFRKWENRVKLGMAE